MRNAPYTLFILSAKMNCRRNVGPNIVAASTGRPGGRVFVGTFLGDLLPFSYDSRAEDRGRNGGIKLRLIRDQWNYVSQIGQ